MSECVDSAPQRCPSVASTLSSNVVVPDPNFLEKLRVYKQVCQKVRSSLVAGRDEIVSPSAFLESLVESNSKKLVGSSGSIDSGIFPGEAPAADSPKGAPKAERSASRSSNGSTSGGGGECRFVEPAEGWTIEYSDKWCEVSKENERKRERERERERETVCVHAFAKQINLRMCHSYLKSLY